VRARFVQQNDDSLTHSSIRDVPHSGL
jgi:hypothetical protein